MFTIFLFLSFIVGLLIGSFLNVVIYRYNTSLSVVSGRSQCLQCGHTLFWYELIPLFSFLFQGGKCRECQTKISWQYPLVECISGVLFVSVFMRQYNLYNSIYSFYTYGLVYSSIFLLFYFCIVSILLIIAVYDIRHKIIPDSLVYWFIGLSLVKLFIFLFICLPNSFNTNASIAFISPYIYDLCAPLILFIPFWLLWTVSKGQWIGFGDAKLALGIGALLGFVSGLSAIVIGFWVGAIVCVIVLGIQYLFPSLIERYFGHLGARSEIPLGPFLILGTFIVLFSQIDVLGIAGLFNV